MAKYVMGTYANVQEAKEQVDEMTREGYPNDSISVMADQSMVSNLGDLGVMVEDESMYSKADETTWQRIKNFFGGRDYDEKALKGHQQELRDGRVLLMVDCDLVPDHLESVAKGTDTDYWDLASGKLVDRDNDTIRLQQEHLRANKDSVEAGEVTIRKRVVQETESIDVPVEHEELVIERHAVTDRVAGDADFDEDTITIPLMTEQVHVTKEPVVTEEVNVRKREVTDTKRYSDTVRREELDVEKSGNVVVGGANNQSAGAPPV